MNNKIVVDVEVNGLEKLLEQAQEMVLLAEDMVDIQNELSVFEAELGNGIKFKGTKSDFEVFMQGVADMFAIAKALEV